jgi:hypothetical protein
VKRTLEVTVENADGEEETHDLPAKNEVCPECDGEGFVLRDGMRGHAYSAEEFAESFDEEEAAEYFRRGGRYDQTCPCCQGRNVVAVPDVENMTPAQKLIHAAWEESEERRARSEAEDRATMRMECGGW